MIAGVDSAYPPSAGAIAQGVAAGIKLWAGYFAGPNILNGWSLSDFQRVRNGGMAALAFCSGWSDPVAMKTQATAWGVPICLDVEGGIRGSGSWVQPWLDTSGAGIYGNAPVHVGISAPFHILAAYPGFDPQATWSGAKPSVPCGWQWQGSHTAFGVTVDSAWYDDQFQAAYSGGSGSIGGDDMTPEEHAWLQTVVTAVTMAPGPVPARLAQYTLAQLWEIINNSTWDGITSVYGQESHDFLYALAHPAGVSGAVGALKAQIAALPTATVNIQPVLDAVHAIPTVDFKPVLDAVAAVKTELDAIRPTTPTDLTALEASVTAIQTAVTTIAKEQVAIQTLAKIKTELG